MEGLALSHMALSSNDVIGLLDGELSLWHFKENALERVYHAVTYLDALDLLNKVAWHAEAVNHHPDLLLNWKTLVIRYWTHTVNGVTDLDVEQARAVERLLE